MNDRASTQLVEINGERFLVLLFRTIQAIKLYDDGNELVREAVTHLMNAASEILVESEFTMLILDGGYYVQGKRFRYHRKTGKIIQGLLDTFTDRGLYGFTFHPAMLNVQPELLKFLRYLIQSFSMEHPHDWLSDKIADPRFAWVEILDEEMAKQLRLEAPDNILRARETYQKSIASVKEVTRRLQAGSHTGIWKSKRVVQNMVDLVRDDEALSIGMATIKHYDDYTYVHSVNVAVLSVCLGNRIGLSRSSLTLLGICGLFHDLGKVEIDPAIIRKPGELDSQEWDIIKKHPLGSMRQILKLNTTYQLKSKVFLSPLEHHLHFDLSGYPKIKSKKKISLFGKILKIADVYDALTSPRVYRRFYYSPQQVLRVMMKSAGTEFDPILLKIFVAMLGQFPIGSLLVLDSSELGLMMRHPPPSHSSGPKVMLLDKGDDGVFVRGEIIDLNERDPQTGDLKRRVARSFHPAVCGVQPAGFFLQPQDSQPNDSQPNDSQALNN
jgi:HD-GYP domain-containing protein (c-di-GMP phosphodiesterase class II)